MRILFVAPYFPSPVRVRPYQWIRALARQGHRVHLVALQPPEDRWLPSPPVDDCCERITVFPLPRLRTLGNAALALTRDLPLQAAYSLCAHAERFIAEAARDADVVHVEHLRGALLARRVRETPCVIDAVDSISALFAQAARSAPSWKQRFLARADLRRTERFEARLTRLFERTIVSSDRDADGFARLGGAAGRARTITLPNGVDLEFFHPSDKSDDREMVLFTGKMSYHANEAAALHLAQRVMPLIWARRPGVQLVLAGKDPSPAIKDLGRDPRIVVTGYVEDLRPHFWSASLALAPMVYGTGIQNKVLEAMACRVPVVASPNACEGLAAPQGDALLVGGDAAALAGHALRLLEDTAQRERLADAGRRYVERHHNWLQLGQRLVAIYEEARADCRRCA